jgi:hypothetical protein
MSDLLTERDNGRKEGLAEGVIMVARNLKLMNMLNDDIIRATGLTIRDIESL